MSIENHRRTALANRQSRLRSEARMAWVIFVIFALVGAGTLGLLGWGFIELIEWVTSK